MTLRMLRRERSALYTGSSKRTQSLSSLFVRLLWLVTMTGLVVSVSAGSTTTTTRSTRESNKPDSWYKRYSSYPPYCSTPQEMESRRIPTLRSDNRHLGETRLVHVTAVIRHGARTPYVSGEKCWDGYSEDKETGVWNCELTTLLAPPSPNRVQEEEGSHQKVDSNSMFLFEKTYDALEGPGRNELNGTCQVGQLLLQGYEQELTNGNLLRDAYLYDGTNMDHDVRMRLLDISFNKYTPWDAPHLYYRADDDQRTLMSGQVLLRGMFGPEVEEHFQTIGTYPIIPVHTADRSQDILDPNEKICYNKWHMESRMNAQQSEEYQAFNNSEQAQEIRTFMKEQLGDGTNHEDILDCLMTTICTDRSLPDAVNDYNDTKQSTNWFQTLTDFSSKEYNLILKHNDSDYSKQTMGPLWSEIMKNINPYIRGEANKDDRDTPSAPQLAVFSGHDTTILPLLASLSPSLVNDTDWPPYASMLLFEIHEIIDGRSDRSVYKTPYAFRLVYNGKVLTSYIDGCPSDADVCDARFLFERVDRFAYRPTDCIPLQEMGDTVGMTNDVLEEAASLVSTAAGIALVVTVMAISCCLGGMLVFVSLTGTVPSSTSLSAVAEGRKVLNSTPRHERSNGGGFDDDDYGYSPRGGQIAMTSFRDNEADEIVFARDEKKTVFDDEDLFDDEFVGGSNIMKP